MVWPTCNPQRAIKEKKIDLQEIDPIFETGLEENNANRSDAKQQQAGESWPRKLLHIAILILASVHWWLHALQNTCKEKHFVVLWLLIVSSWNMDNWFRYNQSAFIKIN